LPTREELGRSIAVLPFESLSENKRDAYFADGVQDEILSNLVKVSQLRVISRTSVMTYRSGGDRDLRSMPWRVSSSIEKSGLIPKIASFEFTELD
jgi:TolB-like protein